jgi:2-polyprenyl-3-methyl-5-hydroxy-6-metoxy-1,4-benzoquinol methylase
MTIKTENLGLPIEYQKLPRFFDSHNIGEDTDEKNSVIEQLLKEQGAKTVYDMTCGTGSQVFYLAERGYDVRGSDLCSDLIDQAIEKSNKRKLTLSLDVADIRVAHKGKFDAVISIFSAIGHLSRSDF